MCSLCVLVPTRYSRISNAQYTIFEQLKNLLERRRKTRIGPYDSFYLGALRKLAATTITYPYLTVKSRAHVRGASKVKAGPDEGMFASFSRILEEEGWEGLVSISIIGTKRSALIGLHSMEVTRTRLCRV